MKLGLLMFSLLFSFESKSQLQMRLEKSVIAYKDTVEINFKNTAAKKAFYYVSFDIYIDSMKRWQQAINDIWNNIPKTELWVPIDSKNYKRRKFVLMTDFLSHIEPATKSQKARFVLHYSYSNSITHRHSQSVEVFLVRM